MISFIFSGCTKIIEVPYIVQASCPKIETLKVVERIQITADANGSIVTEANTKSLVKGAEQLRKSEQYYFNQINKYNDKFVITLDNP